MKTLGAKDVEGNAMLQHISKGKFSPISHYLKYETEASGTKKEKHRWNNLREIHEIRVQALHFSYSLFNATTSLGASCGRFSRLAAILWLTDINSRRYNVNSRWRAMGKFLHSRVVCDLLTKPIGTSFLIGWRLASGFCQSLSAQPSGIPFQSMTEYSRLSFPCDKGLILVQYDSIDLGAGSRTATSTAAAGSILPAPRK